MRAALRPLNYLASVPIYIDLDCATDKNMLLAKFDEIEKNSTNIVEMVGTEAVEVSRYIFARYRKVDPAKDKVFQFLFRSAYRIDNAGLTVEFKKKFFEIFREAKNQGCADIREIVRTLQPIPNKRGHPSLQFSFATKLANTVDSTMPLYDDWVAKTFCFQKPRNHLDFESRLSQYMAFYNVLRTLYEKIIEEDLLAGPREHFRRFYAPAATKISEQKILDFIFWSAGKLNFHIHVEAAPGQIFDFTFPEFKNIPRPT